MEPGAAQAFPNEKADHQALRLVMKLTEVQEQVGRGAGRGGAIVTERKMLANKEPGQDVYA